MRNRAKTDALGLPIRSEIGFRARNEGLNQNESEISTPKTAPVRIGRPFSAPKSGFGDSESGISGAKRDFRSGRKRGIPHFRRKK